MLNRLARLLDRGPSLEVFEAEVDRLVDRLRRHVDGLDEPTARKVAHEVATGAISARELDALLAYVARHVADGTAQAPPWGVFAGVAKKIFARHGLRW